MYFTLGFGIVRVKWLSFGVISNTSIILNGSPPYMDGICRELDYFRVYLVLKLISLKLK